MSVSTYQKILGTIKQWFEIVQDCKGPVPMLVRVRFDEAEHHQSMSKPGYRILNQRCKR